jgi:hypothetical protein
MTFAFEYAHTAAQNRYSLLEKLLKLTVDTAEIGFKNAVKEGEFDIIVEIDLNDQREYLRAEYEQMVVEHFEGYGYLIAHVAPWKWFISCDPSRWENE